MGLRKCIILSISPASNTASFWDSYSFNFSGIYIHIYIYIRIPGHKSVGFSGTTSQWCFPYPYDSQTTPIFESLKDMGPSLPFLGVPCRSRSLMVIWSFSNSGSFGGKRTKRPGHGRNGGIPEIFPKKMRSFLWFLWQIMISVDGSQIRLTSW